MGFVAAHGLVEFEKADALSIFNAGHLAPGDVPEPALVATAPD